MPVAISLRISSHFPPIDNSKLVNPVMSRSGFARLVANPLPIGSVTTANTIGIEWPARRRVVTAGVPLRSEEHTSELQSHLNLVCRLLLEKKKKTLNSSLLPPPPPHSPTDSPTHRYRLD